MLKNNIKKTQKNLRLFYFSDFSLILITLKIIRA